MIIKRIDFTLSRLKQGFDSPRERQQYQVLTAFSARAVGAFFNFSSTRFSFVAARSLETVRIH
jgi:hypothetical protein